ncbi:hypothetical protein [Romboutsia sp.]|uniref:hypothetical protein n=1 Tax=Romboutsia sp. TaxID=1965302 RepID=UPI003F3FDA06
MNCELLVNIDDIKSMLNMHHDEDDNVLAEDLKSIQNELLNGRTLDSLTQEEIEDIKYSIRLEIREVYNAQEQIKISKYTENKKLIASGGWNL